MKYLKKFDKFNEAMMSEPEVAPEPTTRPGKPSTNPNTEPNKKPSPIRRDKPAVTPEPKALRKLKKATAEDVIDRYNELTK